MIFDFYPLPLKRKKCVHVEDTYVRLLEAYFNYRSNQKIECFSSTKKTQTKQ